jgi:transcription elongation factor Elf1
MADKSLDFQEVPDENFLRLRNVIEKYPRLPIILNCKPCGNLTPHVVKKVEASTAAACAFCGGVTISKSD